MLEHCPFCNKPSPGHHPECPKAPKPDTTPKPIAPKRQRLVPKPKQKTVLPPLKGNYKKEK